jgi:hypothetical protein
VSDGAGSWTITPPPGATYTHATLRYQVSDGVTFVTPAANGRALGLVTPLTGSISQAEGAAVVVRTLDPDVVGVSCPTAPTGGAVCGNRTPTGWTATVPDGTSRMVVLLQLNTKR